MPPDGQQVTWDAPQSAAPPQVSWDEEKKPPEKKSFWQKGWEGLTQKLPRPAGGGEESELSSTSSEGLGELGGLARESAQKSQQEDLRKTAATGQQPSFGRKALQYAKNVGASTLNTAAGVTSPTSQAIGAGMMVAPEIVGPALVAHGTYTAGKNLPEAIHGNPEAAETALNAGAEAAGGGAVTAGALAPNAPKTFTRNALTTAKNTLIKGEPPAAMVPEAHKAFTQAIQPGVNIPRAQESIQIAGPRMKQVMEDEGLNLRREKGDNAVPVTKKALDVIKTAKQQVHAAIEDRLGPVAELQPDTSSVADAMEQSISGRTQRQFPKDAAAIQKRADTYRGNLSLREIENSIQDANNELRNYYKRPGGTDSPTPAHMDATLAEVKTLRNLLDEKVESLSGEGVKDLKREYGALRDVERATAKQHAIATRTKEGGLWEGLAYMHAAGDLLSGNALGAVKGAGAITVGRALKTLRDPNFLIEQSFHGPKAFEAAPRIAPHAGPPAPRGLLPAPLAEATPMGGGGPDTSGPVRGGRYTTPAALIPERPTTPATFLREIPRAAREAVQGPKALLPAPRTTTIPPAVEEKFATEPTGRAADETKLGPRGQGGVRIPIKGALPAAREALGTPQTTKPAPEMPRAGSNPPEVQKAAKEAGAFSAGYQPGNKPGNGHYQFHDPELGGSFYLKEGEVTPEALKAKMAERKTQIEPSPLVEEKTANAKRAFDAAALQAAKEPEPVKETPKPATEEPKSKATYLPQRSPEAELGERVSDLTRRIVGASEAEKQGIANRMNREEARAVWERINMAPGHDTLAMKYLQERLRGRTETAEAAPKQEAAAKPERPDIEKMSLAEVEEAIPKVRNEIADLKARKWDSPAEKKAVTEQLNEAYDHVGKLVNAREAFDREAKRTTEKADKKAAAAKAKKEAADAEEADRKGTRDLVPEGGGKGLSHKEFFKAALKSVGDAWEKKIGPENMDEARSLQKRLQGDLWKSETNQRMNAWSRPKSPATFQRTKYTSKSPEMESLLS